MISIVKKYMQSRLLVFVFTILCIQVGVSQHAFHRIYPSIDGRSIITISSTQMKDGNYAALEMYVKQDENEVFFSDTLVVTSYKPKGDINWSKSITIETAYGGFQPALGSIIQGDNDSLYFSFVSLSTDKPNKILGAISNGGSLGDMKTYTTEDLTSDGTNIGHFVANFKKHLYTAHVGGNEEENDINFSKKSYAGDNLFSKLLGAKDENGGEVSEIITKMSAQPDSTFLLTGLVDSLNTAPFIAVLDSLGEVLMSRKYFDIQAFFATPIAYDAIRLPDSTYAISGWALEITPSFDITIKGFIIKTLKNGEVDWGKKVVFDPADISAIKHITLSQDNNILIAGVNLSSASQEFTNFVCKLSPSGEVIWQNSYPGAQGTFDFTGGLFPTIDDGSAYITTSVEGEVLRPSFIKLDNAGSTTCEVAIEENIFVDNSFISDTLIWTYRDAGVVGTIAAESAPHTYNVPFVSLEVRPFCPNEPIDWTFRVPIAGATNYKWSTGAEGATLDSLRVFEEGEYSVTVTVGEGVCFMLCDTSKIGRYSEPAAGISLNIGNFCTNNQMSLALGYQPGHPDIKSFVWSTGQNGVNPIEIATPGTYSVTLVDGCDEEATATINTGDFPKKITSATITGDFVTDCFTGQNIGQLSANGNSVGLGVERYLWSSGESSQNIAINDSDNDTYTVTVTDGCGNTASADKAARFSNDGISSISINVDKGGICIDKSVSLNAISDRESSKLTYLWSTGSTNPSIRINTIGTYTVTVTDLCNNTVAASQEITDNDITPQDISYAHVFFPDGVGPGSGGGGQDSAFLEVAYLNRSFGPINKSEFCLDAIDGYEFYIFNRWGQQVFESKDIIDEWDGTKLDTKWPSDTYVWMAKYSIFGFSKTVKGDVTLIR